jgi:hypothetical protein
VPTPPDDVVRREREFEIERESPKSAICAAAPALSQPHDQSRFNVRTLFRFRT